MSDITELKLEFSSITSTTCCDKGTWANAIAAHSRTMAADTPLPNFSQFIEKSPQFLDVRLLLLCSTRCTRVFQERNNCLAVGGVYSERFSRRREKLAREKYLVHACQGSYRDQAQRLNGA